MFTPKPSPRRKVGVICKISIINNQTFTVRLGLQHLMKQTSDDMQDRELIY